MKAQSCTLRLEIPLKPICLVSGKVGSFEGLWRAIQVPGKYAEQGAKGTGTSAEEAWCEVLTTSAGAGPGFPCSHSQQGRAWLCRAGSAVGTAAGSLRQQEPHIFPILLWQNWLGWRHLSFPSSVFAVEDTASFYFSRLADPSMLQIHKGK